MIIDNPHLAISKALSPVQWIGPHRITAHHAGNRVVLFEAQLDHRPRPRSVSLKYLNGRKSKKPKTVYKMVLRLTAWLLANNSMMQLETPAGVS